MRQEVRKPGPGKGEQVLVAWGGEERDERGEMGQ